MSDPIQALPDRAVVSLADITALCGSVDPCPDCTSEPALMLGDSKWHAATLHQPTCPRLRQQATDNPGVTP